MFHNFNDKAFQSTLDSLNGSDTITIDYINKEVKLKRESTEENHQKD
jgi:hypothetical protein